MDLNKAFRDAFDKSQPLKRIPKFRKKRFPSNFNKQKPRINSS